MPEERRFSVAVMGDKKGMCVCVCVVMSGAALL